MSPVSEKLLDKAIEAELQTSPELVTWVLSKTKFADRGGKYYWSRTGHPWCRMPLKTEIDTGEVRYVESETDVLVVFEGADGRRFALHIENKLSSGKFQQHQPELYKERAKRWIGDPKYGGYSDFETLLIAPIEFQRRFAKDAEKFDRFISHEELGAHMPVFAAS